MLSTIIPFSKFSFTPNTQCIHEMYIFLVCTLITQEFASLFFVLGWIYPGSAPHLVVTMVLNMPKWFFNFISQPHLVLSMVLNMQPTPQKRKKGNRTLNSKSVPRLYGPKYATPPKKRRNKYGPTILNLCPRTKGKSENWTLNSKYVPHLVLSIALNMPPSLKKGENRKVAPKF